MFAIFCLSWLRFRTKEQFLEDLATVSMSIDKYMVISFSRKSMGQSGNGHYSPIATYNPERRQALVLDVARFKYPSYWAPVDLLWDAMEPHDLETDAPRGYFILSRGQRKAQSLCKITSECPMYLVGDIVRNRIPAAVALESPVESIDELVRIALSSVPKEHSCSLSFATVGIDLAGPGLTHEHETDMNKLIEEIEHNELYQIVEKVISSCNGIFCVNEGNNAQIRAALGTIFLLACPRRTFANASPNIQRCLSDYRNSASASDILREEIMRISEQIASCCDRLCCEQKRLNGFPKSDP